MKLRTFLKIGLLCLALTLWFAFETKSEAKVIKWQYALGPTVPGSSYQFYQEEEIPRRVKEATGGALELIPHKELVQAADILDAVRDRRVDMGVQGTMYRAELALFNYLTLPVILPFEALPKIHPRVLPILSEVARDQFQVELAGFGYWPRQLLMSKRPAATFDALKGLKFRVHSHEILSLMQAAGGAPVSMPYVKVYLAMQRGTIDGAVSSMVAFRGAKWYEVTKYIDWWPMGNTGYLFVVNKDSWNELPDNLKKIVGKTISEAAMETWKAADLDDQNIKEEFETKYKCQILYPSEEEIKQLGKMMPPVIEGWKKRAGERSGEVMSIVNDVLGTNY